MPHPVKAVLLDFGDTLVQFGPIDHAAAFREAVRETHALWRRRKRCVPPMWHYALRQWLALRFGHAKRRLTGREIDAVELVQRACANVSLTAPRSFYEALLWHWYAPLARRAWLEPGTHRTLARLQASGYRLGIVSNTFVPGFVLDRHLLQLGLLRFFPHRIYSANVGQRKPSPAMFHLACRAVGCLPHEVVMVGDQWRADVRGAQRAGLGAIHKCGHAGALTGRAVPWIQRLEELPGVLNQLHPIDGHARLRHDTDAMHPSPARL